MAGVTHLSNCEKKGTAANSAGVNVYIQPTRFTGCNLIRKARALRKPEFSLQKSHQVLTVCYESSHSPDERERGKGPADFAAPFSRNGPPKPYLCPPRRGIAGSAPRRC